MVDLKKIDEWFDSEECEKSIAEFTAKRERYLKVKNKQLERLRKNGNFSDITKKVIEKYSSNEYKDKWYGRNIEPTESLFWFLYSYSVKYGRECGEKEWEQYGNMFTTSLYYVDGYYFNRMDGQGSIIKVIKA